MATDTGKVERHAGVDRLFHWITAVTMFVLLGTSLLPIVGIRFAWVEIHWIAGIVLTIAVLFHVLRALIWQGLRTMLLGSRDVAEATGKVLPGKYSLAQKLMHHAFSLSLLVAVVTGVLMMVKVGTPFFERDPYLYTLKTWGIITLLHDLSALLAVFLVIVHVYFSLLPEKRMYLRSMIRGWVTREELRQHHDVDRWPGRSGLGPQ
ncbi:MAG TPA: cytochrome b/b6 domain-containing protein [Steroidobacteraceae bacterium]|jgi:cytochrome b subunit of formate dehydrogenase|nr:cytochrome b/b6 domain-containing protein [Steroidobacteraceae bacterium]